MNLTRVLREYQTLNAILEILNEEIDFSKALQLALEQLVNLLGLSTAWVFIAIDHNFQLVAFTGLPKALSVKQQTCLRDGSCTCQGRFNRGVLDKGVNIVDCSRLEGVEEYKAGLVVHASVPLLTEDGAVGILNLAAPDMDMFDDETLQFLTVVGRSLGLGFRRAQLQELQLREREALAKFEERHRLARDIQHSVSQLLQAVGTSLQVAMRQPQYGETLRESSSLLHASLSGLQKLDVLLQPSDGLQQFTPKERDVLGFIAKGLSNKQIAKALQIAEKTVKVHVSHILGKLELKGRTQLALWAKERGL